MLSESIAALVRYGIDTGLTPECEKIYTTNLLLDLFHEEDYDEPASVPEEPLETILQKLLNEACARELIPNSIAYRDLFDTRIMNCLVPRPAQIRQTFWEKYKTSPPLSGVQGSEVEGFLYIRRYRHHHQPVQAGKRSQGHCCREKREGELLSQMPALYGK